MVEVGQDIDNIFVLDWVDSVSISLIGDIILDL